MAGAEKGLSVGLTGQGETAVGRCSKILLPVLFYFFCLMSQVGVLLYDSPIHQLTERVELEHCQPILELAAKPLPEARLFLLISVYMITSILG